MLLCFKEVRNANDDDDDEGGEEKEGQSGRFDCW